MKLQETFTQQVQQHAGIIHKVISLYVDDAEDRKDLYQEILLQAWRSFQHFRGDAKFSTWLYKVGLNTVLTFQRSAHQKTPKEEVQEWHASEDNSAKTDEAQWLLRAIKQLPETDRMIINLHLEGYKNPEIAEIMGITANHINVKLHRIKNVLTQTLQTV